MFEPANTGGIRTHNLSSMRASAMHATPHQGQSHGYDEQDQEEKHAPGLHHGRVLGSGGAQPPVAHSTARSLPLWTAICPISRWSASRCTVPSCHKRSPPWWWSRAQAIIRTALMTRMTATVELLPGRPGDQPGGQAMARKTYNALLGIVDGISTLGTTGIAKAFSTAAFRASVVQSIEINPAQACKTAVPTTCGRTEKFVITELTELPRSAFVQRAIFCATRWTPSSASAQSTWRSAI